MDNSGRYKIAVVADTPNWAYDNIAIQIKEYLQDSFEVHIFYIRDFENWQALYRFFFMETSFDLVHFLWREVIVNPDIVSPFCLKLSQEERAQYIDGFINTPITASIYDHSCLETDKVEERKFYFNHVASAYTVSSNKLYEIYHSIVGMLPPAAVIEDGVKLELFYPINKERFTNLEKKLVVGWVGNSQWGMEDGIDKKGFHTIVQPAIAELQQEGLPIEGYYADRNEQQIPLELMKEYYAKIDVLVCASLIEGTPNPVLEAMACGVPVVSTDVGIVNQVLGDQQKKFIFDRNKEELKDKLKMLIYEPWQRQLLSEENLTQIMNWTRQTESEKWRTFFLKHCKSLKNSCYCKDRMMKRNLFLSDQMGEYTSLTKQINEYQEAYKNMTQMIDERDVYIKQLETKVNELTQELAAPICTLSLGPFGKYRLTRKKAGKESVAVK